MARTVAKLGQKQGASAWGMKLRADPLGIALINGTSAQGYELDDCHDQSMSHYGAGVVPTVLAAAEGFGPYSGKEIILATVVGYELGTRIGNTVSPHAFNRGFHPCGLTSTFAAAATMGKLLEARRRPVRQRARPRGLAGRRADGLAIWRDGEALPFRQGGAERHARRAAGRRRT